MQLRKRINETENINMEVEKTIEFDRGFDATQYDNPIKIDIGQDKYFKIWMTADVSLVCEYTEGSRATYDDPPEAARLDVSWPHSTLEITDITVELVSEAGGLIFICEDADETDSKVKDFLAFRLEYGKGHTMQDYLKDEVQQLFEKSRDAYDWLLESIENDDPVTAAKEAAQGV